MTRPQWNEPPRDPPLRGASLARRDDPLRESPANRGARHSALTSIQRGAFSRHHASCNSFTSINCSVCFVSSACGIRRRSALGSPYIFPKERAPRKKKRKKKLWVPSLRQASTGCGGPSCPALSEPPSSPLHYHHGGPDSAGSVLLAALGMDRGHSCARSSGAPSTSPGIGSPRSRCLFGSPPFHQPCLLVPALRTPPPVRSETATRSTLREAIHNEHTVWQAIEP
jgi:hypothetical protein